MSRRQKSYLGCEKLKKLIENYLEELNCKKVENLSDIDKLIKVHIGKFCFSSAKVLLKDEISLELEDIYESLVVQKRGGYCFEHNKLMYEALKELGFDVEFYLARVINNSENEVPQTHRFTLLSFDNRRYIIDVGIGFNTPSILVDFDEETASHQGFNYKVKTFDDDTFGLQKIKDGEAYTITKFDLNKCYEADFEMGHLYSHKHPCAVFVNNLVLSLIVGEELRSLRNDGYFKIYEDKKEQVDISSKESFQRVIREDFNLNFSSNEIELLYKNYVKELK